MLQNTHTREQQFLYTSGTLTVVRKNPACASCSTIKCKSCHIPDTEKIEVIDVPGIYRLDPECEAEQVACRLMPEGDIYVNVVDATNLERNLNLTLQLLEFKKPVIIALNMWDDTLHKGISIDVDKLSKCECSGGNHHRDSRGRVDKLIQKY